MIHILLIIIFILLMIKEYKNDFYLRTVIHRIENNVSFIKNTLKQTNVQSNNGDFINIEYYIPDKIKHNNVILFIPGYCSGIEYEPLISLMNEYKKRDYIIYVKNWRGIKSDIVYENEKFFSETAIDDFKTVLNYINKKHKLPIIGIGHSMGGILFLKYNYLYNENNIKKMILISTPLMLNKNYNRFKKTFINYIFLGSYIDIIKNKNENESLKKQLYANTDKKKKIYNLMRYKSAINNYDQFFEWGTVGKEIIDNINKPTLWITSKNDKISYYNGIEDDIDTDNPFFKKIIFNYGEHGNYFNNMLSRKYNLFNKIDHYINNN